MSDRESTRINVVTVTYGNRFVFLKRTLDSVVPDRAVDKIILVDNGSVNGAEIDACIDSDQYGKIILVRHEKNMGSAGGFRAGILEARKHKSDYVLLLDDDNVMEHGWSKYFMNALHYFPCQDAIVLKGNRDNNYYPTEALSEEDKMFKIDYLSITRIRGFFRASRRVGVFQPIIHMPHGANSYGGTLLPFNAIRDTEPPFEPLFLYGDDAEYLFRVSRGGYKAYRLSKPIVDDIDHTFSGGSEYLRAFDENVTSMKVFFMARNLYALSMITKSQSMLSIWLNGIVGISIKIIYAFMKMGINRFTLERSRILIRGFYDGVQLKFDNEENIKRYAE